MELICKIIDEDIGEKFTNMENPKLRLAARGKVLEDTKQLNVIEKEKMREQKCYGTLLKMDYI